MKTTCILILVILLGFVPWTSGHGRLWEPPSRSSMWRRGYNTSINIDDNELSCGGFTNQWIVNNGLCGVCGDPFQQPHPRDNEHGGTYASGLITRTYPVGAIVEVVIGLTANHGGYFEFKLCPLFEADGFTKESQECMDKHRLRILGADGEGFEYHIKDHLLVGEVRLSVILPADLYCKHCVLQWKYRTGTRWGCDAVDLCGHGLGPQEEFYGCSDIAISDVTSMIHLVPKQTENQDKVGLNDLGSKHHRKQGPDFDKMTSGEPVIKFVAHKSASYNITTLDNNDVNNIREPANNSTTNIVSADPFMSFMENLLMNSIKNYYNRNADGKVGVTACEAVALYQNNPIINEWCRKTCPTEQSLCPRTICKCAKIPPKHWSTVQQPSLNHYTEDKTRLRLFAHELISESKKHDITNKENNASTVDSIIDTLPEFKHFIGSHSINSLRSHSFSKKDTDFDNRSIQTQRPSWTTGELIPSPSQKATQALNTKVNTFQTHSDIELQSVVTTTPTYTTNNFKCTASKKFAHNEFMANWCQKNCSFGFCPKMVCTCSS